MPFFDDASEVPEHDLPEPKRKRWRGAADDTLGVAVPYGEFLVRNDDIAVIVTGLVAFPVGFTVIVVALSRLDDPTESLDMSVHSVMGRSSQSPDQAFRFGIEFSDGSRVTNDAEFGYSRREPAQPLLRHRGGSSGGRRASQGFWCTPLPPPGPMRFVCRWLAQGVEETSLQLDAQVILDAAARAVPVWPEDVDLPEDEEQPGAVRNGWSWRSSRPKSPE